MVVYRVLPHRSSISPCSGSYASFGAVLSSLFIFRADALLPPLIMHTSHPAETHYFPWIHHPDRGILLHTHLEGPFIDSSALGSSTVDFTIYTSRESQCQKDLIGFDVTIDWIATFGRWASRYLNALVSWSAGVAALIVFLGWNQETDGEPFHGGSASRALFSYVLQRRYQL